MNFRIAFLPALSLAALLTLTGCVTMDVPGLGSINAPQVDPRGVLKDQDSHELKMLKAKVQAAKDLAPPPILEITAQPGEQITFSGVQSIKVNAPSSNTAIMAELFKEQPGTLEKVADYSLRALGILVNPWASIKIGEQNAITQRLQIEANTRQHEVTFGTLQGVATGAFNNIVYRPVTPSVAPAMVPAVPPVGAPQVAPSE